MTITSVVLHQLQDPRGHQKQPQRLNMGSIPSRPSYEQCASHTGLPDCFPPN